MLLCFIFQLLKSQFNGVETAADVFCHYTPDMDVGYHVADSCRGIDPTCMPSAEKSFYGGSEIVTHNKNNHLGLGGFFDG